LDRLRGKSAIVTGAGTGIGRGIALAFAREGARVLAAGRRLEKLQETVTHITEGGGESLAFSVDVSSPADVTRMIDECRARLGDPSILVNNAGVHVPGRVLDIEAEQWDWIMSLLSKLTAIPAGDLAISWALDEPGPRPR
jgi:NAD(P)-dependent dehydrogenase (short-subunit alcohol dehydrogenase family)